ncbi:MAG TPA: hypothetical protein VGL89_01400 [Candidatus Koribacter sp.]|jgi:DNA-binding beta-propeller fold protein YncE
MHHRRNLLLAAALVVLCAAALPAQTFLGGLKNVSTIASTVPANGDVNPYGIFEVPESSGKLTAGHFLISNFNNGANLQGTGTTIMDIAPSGAVHQFAKIDASALPGSCPGGVGLTTALVVLKTGWVIVGSLPTSDGTSATAKAGCLLVLNNMGKVVETFSGGNVNGPWDMTAIDDDHFAVLFFTNVLNGTVAHSPNVVHEGTVVRMVLSVSKSKMPAKLTSHVIGSSFPERTDPGALVIGPTGVAFSLGNDTLYVADSLNNRIAAIHNALIRDQTAGTGDTVLSGESLNDPLGLAIAPDGHLIIANGNNGDLVEVTQRGHQVAHKLVDNTGNPPGAGTLFGLDVKTGAVFFVDDGSNTLNVFK